VAEAPRRVSHDELRPWKCAVDRPSESLVVTDLLKGHDGGSKVRSVVGEDRRTRAYLRLAHGGILIGTEVMVVAVGREEARQGRELGIEMRFRDLRKHRLRLGERHRISHGRAVRAPNHAALMTSIEQEYQPFLSWLHDPDAFFLDDRIKQKARSEAESPWIRLGTRQRVGDGLKAKLDAHAGALLHACGSRPRGRMASPPPQQMRDPRSRTRPRQ
jgi:hypothetical protein